MARTTPAPASPKAAPMPKKMPGFMPGMPMPPKAAPGAPKGKPVPPMKPGPVSPKKGKAGYAKKPHPGFAAVSSKIENKEGVSKERADAILAASSRNASPKAKKDNPRLKKV